MLPMGCFLWTKRSFLDLTCEAQVPFISFAPEGRPSL